MAMGRPKQSRLDREIIIQKSIAILETDGLTSFNLRKLAERMSVNPASIYHYFKSKDDILHAVVGVLLREMELPQTGGDWKTFFIETAVRYWRYLVQRPFLTSLATAGFRPVTEVDEYNSMMLSRAKIPEQFHPDIFMAFDACTTGFANMEIARITVRHEDDHHRPDPEGTLRVALEAVLEHLLKTITEKKQQLAAN